MFYFLKKINRNCASASQSRSQKVFCERGKALATCGNVMSALLFDVACLAAKSDRLNNAHKNRRCFALQNFYML